uniref:Zinc finger ZPR1-type domain-containing protein n=1 Tax=Gorilla gorilla gorilla TaxID=9595 RepID=A0A2I2Z345_GORGO
RGGATSFFLGSPGSAVAPSPALDLLPALGHLFRPISTEDKEQQPTQIKSLCMNCYRNGMTRLLLTKIPFFREIIVSSFSCHHCGWNNMEIQSAGRIQDKGVRYTLSIRALEDMNREVVKTDSATTRIPELDFQIPAFSQKGALNTVEGLITRAISDATAERIDEFIVKLKELKQSASPFTLIIDDPSGNSFVENPHAAQKDDALVITHYNQTLQQEEMLGLQAEAPTEKPEEEDLRNEVLQFNTNGPECNAPTQTNMKLNCVHQTNEVKSGEAVEPLGTRITLHITGPSDMTRDLLKSETCSVEIPECKFTTLEGLLKDIWELVTKNPFTLGDSSNPGQTERLQEFSQKMDQIIEGNMKTDFIMDDPAGNSYLQNVYATEDDPEMKELELNDMKTEGYEAGLAPQR